MTRVVTALLALITLLTFLSLVAGDIVVPLGEVLTLLYDPAQADPQTWAIVVDLRLTRALMAMLVGGALGCAGAMTQAMMRNPLAEPGILGINAGAALAATAFIVLLEGRPPELLPWTGFAGALAAAALIYFLAWRHGASPLKIILIGIGLSAVAGAITTLLTTFAPIATAQRALIWLSGSIYLADWATLRTFAPWLIAPSLLSLLAVRQLDLLGFDDTFSRTLGLRVDAARAYVILLCALICGAAVAAVGPIGFVGLIAPHAARRLVGPRHTQLLPVSALVGASLLVAADLAGRTALSPLQVPAGLVVALIGAPFFAWLLSKGQHVRA